MQEGIPLLDQMPAHDPRRRHGQGGPGAPVHRPLDRTRRPARRFRIVAMLGDITLAEPGRRSSVLPARGSSRRPSAKKLPERFQRAEYLSLSTAWSIRWCRAPSSPRPSARLLSLPAPALSGRHRNAGPGECGGNAGRQRDECRPLRRRPTRFLARLMQLHPKRIDLSLGGSSAFWPRSGNPHENLPPVIHVAGTKGKGLDGSDHARLLERAGYPCMPTPRRTSSGFTERIRLSRKADRGGRAARPARKNASRLTAAHRSPFFRDHHCGRLPLPSCAPRPILSLLEVGDGRSARYDQCGALPGR